MMFVAHREDRGDVAEGFRGVLGENGDEIGAAATMDAMGGFVDESMLIEVEVDAVAED